MPDKKTVSAREVVADIRVGMTDDQLMAKHQLSPKGLQSLKNKLLSAGLINESDLDEKSNATEVGKTGIDKRLFARTLAQAIKTGLCDSDIVNKYGVSVERLPGLFASLIKMGY